MATLFEFSQAISKLNKEKKFSDSLKYFKENKVQFKSEQIASNDYLISAMLTALRQTDNFDYAFKFLELYKITIDKNTKEIILSAYGWLLYSKFKAENQLNEDHQIENETFDDEEIITTAAQHYTKNDIITKIVSFLPLILKVNNDYAYSVISMLFNSVLKAEKKKPNANWKLVNEICDLISPDQLHTDCKTIEVERKGQRKPMELASDKENWFAYKSKALIKLGLFQKCYEISKRALETFDKFHYSNDIWFARRIALSKKNLGNSSDAIAELQQILKRKKEWFIQKELAVLYQESGDIDKSFNYAIAAINNFGDIEYKVDLLFLLGELLKTKQENDLAFKHLSLSQLLRIKEGWKIPVKLQSTLSQFENPNIPIEKLHELKNELKKYWQFAQQSNLPKFEGKIKNILPNGLAGFITGDDKKDYFFSLSDYRGKKEEITIGLLVQFNTEKGYDKKKGQESDKATNITMMTNKTA